MTATYTPFTRDIDRVRFHIGDTSVTSVSNVKFSDEELTAIVTELGSWPLAVIACFRNLIAKLDSPDFSADWLTVNTSELRKGYLSLIREKTQEFSEKKYSGFEQGGVRKMLRSDSNEVAEGSEYNS